MFPLAPAACFLCPSFPLLPLSRIFFPPLPLSGFMLTQFPLALRPLPFPLPFVVIAIALARVAAPDLRMTPPGPVVFDHDQLVVVVVDMDVGRQNATRHPDPAVQVKIEADLRIVIYFDIGIVVIPPTIDHYRLR
jgi:hypothetical protein